MRPHNETSEDLFNENSAKVRCERAWRCRLQKLPDYTYQADWCITRDNVVHGFAEFKKRKQQYDEMYLSLSKWMALQRLIRATGLPAFMVFQVGESIFWRKYAPDRPPMRVEWRGNRRGQDGDIEPVVMLPFNEFTILKE